MIRETLRRDRPSLMVVTSGWYGLGHMTPVSAVVEALRQISDAHISLFTLPFEVPRLERRGQQHLFDKTYVGAASTALDYQEYMIRHYQENRIRFHHAFQQEQPDLLLFHWMMLIECIDVACLARCRVVALLEETEWGHVVPGLAQARHFPFVDEVIFCDNLDTGTEGLTAHQHRVGLLTSFAAEQPGAFIPKAEVAARLGLPASLPLVLVNTAGGSYRKTHRYIEQLLHTVTRRPDLGFLFMVGPMLPRYLRAQIQEKARKRANTVVVSDPQPDEIRAYITAADLSIHSGGISSTAECLALRKKFLVINPVGSDRENDACRVRQLVQEGLCYMVETSVDGEAEALSEAIDRALASNPTLERVPKDGARQAAQLLKRWLESPVEKAVSNQSAVVCIFAPDVPRKLRLAAVALVPAAWQYVAIDLPGSALANSLSLDLEVGRMHRLLASLRIYEQTLFVAVTGPDPGYDWLLHALLLDHDVLVVSSRPLALEARFVTELEEQAGPPLVKNLRGLPGAGGCVYRVVPPAPEYEDYVEEAFSPFLMTR